MTYLQAPDFLKQNFPQSHKVALRHKNKKATVANLSLQLLLCQHPKKNLWVFKT